MGAPPALRAALAGLNIPSQTVDSVFDRLGKAAGANGALRVQMAGSWLLQLANDSTMTPLEQLYRKLPQDALFAASPSNPVVTELGSFTVPESMVLLVLDWRFDVYRPSGIAVGDVVPFEDRRLALQLGWDIVFAAKRPSNLEYQITPSQSTARARAAYASNPNAGIIPSNGPIPAAPQTAFDRARFIVTQEPAGPGAALLPQRHRRDVQPQMPFTYIVEANQRVQLLSIAFQPVTVPIAFFEGEFSGMLLGANAFKEFMNSAVPCV